MKNKIVFNMLYSHLRKWRKTWHTIRSCRSRLDNTLLEWQKESFHLHVSPTYLE